MTEKIFYTDQYQEIFTASVTDCKKAEKYYEIILDRTCFYPEGGGQPADKGTLNDIDVLDVKELEKSIVHFTENPIEKGTEVCGKINFGHRFRLMQLHSGEHIFSGIANSLYGCNNIGFHMGKEFITVDFDRQLNGGEITEAELRANIVIYNNIEIKSLFPTPAELENINYRSKKQIDGQVRLIEIAKTDICACCGLHTAKTGEIGLLKVLSHQNYKGGTRIFMSAGLQAFEDYLNKNTLINELSVMLSSKKDKLTENVEQLLFNTDDSKKKFSRLSEKYIDLLVRSHNPDIHFIFEEELNSDALRILCTKLKEKYGIATALAFSDMGNGEIKYSIASENDAREINEELSSKFNCKGGGNSRLCQGTISCTDKELLISFIKKY